MTQRSVLVVLYDGVQSLDVTGPVEVFAGASRFPGAGYESRTASLDGAPVRTCSGLTLVPDGRLADAEPPHTLLVPGGEGTRAPTRRSSTGCGNTPRAPNGSSPSAPEPCCSPGPDCSTDTG